MEHILKELWYGKIKPLEHLPTDSPEYRKRVRDAIREREILSGTLRQDEKKRLERYDAKNTAVQEFLEQEAFCAGFRLAFAIWSDFLCGR